MNGLFYQMVGRLTGKKELPAADKQPRYALVIFTNNHRWVMDPAFYADCVVDEVVDPLRAVGKVYWILTLSRAENAQDSFVQIHDIIVRPRDVKEVVWCKL